MLSRSACITPTEACAIDSARLRCIAGARRSTRNSTSREGSSSDSAKVVLQETVRRTTLTPCARGGCEILPLRKIRGSLRGRIRILTDAAKDARSVTDVEFSEGRARRLVAAVEQLPLPAPLRDYWKKTAAAARARLAKLR